MPLFTYTAQDKQGKIISETASFASKEEFMKSLVKRGLTLQSYKIKEQRLSLKEKLNQLNEKVISLSSVPVSEKIFFTQNLMVMIRAGISISQALKTLKEQTSNQHLKQILTDVYQKVDRGISLAESLEPYKKEFGELYINMIKTGEAGGQLEQVLNQLTIQMKKDHHIKSKVKGALVYPTIVIVAMIIIMILMFVFVIPQITSIFKEVDAELPLPTVILISISDFVVNNGPLVALMAIITIAGFIRFIKSKKGKVIWHAFLLKLPIISQILKKVNLARFARTISSLLKTDIPITEVFHITSHVLGNSSYQKVVFAAAEELKKGVNIYTTLSKYPHLFPPIVTHMVAVGEETGSLDEILEQLAIFYEEEVDQTMSTLTSTLEPILMLLLGLGVGSIAVAVIMPMYSLTQQF